MRAPHDPGATHLEGDTPEERVVSYHERTKHHLHRYAASPGRMEWATQPDPFRRYAGADLVRLPLPEPGRSPPYWALHVPGRVAPEPLSLASVSTFFRYALSVTAWKQLGGARWALRANPSSGNLHPTEGYAVLPALEGLHERAAVYHYAPREHALERRAELDPGAWAELMAGFPEGALLVGLSSIHWREAWKYGERAYRYCQHDVGHALAAARVAAAALGWRLSLLADVGDAGAGQLLGLDRDADAGGAEREHPDLVAVMVPASGDRAAGAVRDPLDLPRHLPDGGLRAVADGRWRGRANLLSPAHVHEWPVIDEVARAAWRAGAPKPTEREDLSRSPAEDELFAPVVRSGALSAEQVILGRRSAVRMDGTTSISREAFLLMLARLVPARGGRAVPWDAIPWRPRIHVGLFVHRVRALAPGLYVLARDPEAMGALRAAMRADFLWRRPSGCPPGLELYLLEEGDCRELAAGVSCGQDIAGDGAFSLGMLANVAECLRERGAAFYRNLFWEAGMVGQLLYLEAEEAGARGTGIGCYFDDAVREVFGLAQGWESLYHFTVGGHLEDARLTSLPAYAP
jgi:SagB-type dehydrogenase family enzyme